LKEKQERLLSEEMPVNTSMQFQNQLLDTKFFVPVALGPLISRPRLATLLSKSLEHSLTLVSAPAGFGKTTLLVAWTQSLPPNHPLVAWVSLDEEDNDPRLFWTYAVTALNRLQPEHFSSLLMEMQSPQTPPLKYLLNTLINLLSESTTQFLLILDDYQVITEPEIHTTLAYLVEHLPAQLRLILSTRSDPPLPLPLLRSHHQILEIRTNQLRCTAEETKTFFEQVMGIQLSEETIQAVTARMEGWLVGLHLLGLSLGKQINPATLLQEISGDQHYFLDYLTEVVLHQQPQEVQSSILARIISSILKISLPT
jgi:LuxR family maltose regulon positive regulatory protein